MNPLRHAFTLVELLVTLGIVVILALLIFAGVNYAIEAGKSAVCMGNLKALGVGFNLYLAEHQGQFPKAYGNPNNAWTSELLKGGYVSGKSFQCPSLADKVHVDAGPPWQQWNWWGSEYFVSYGYNYRNLDTSLGQNWSPPPPYRPPLTLGALTRPSSVILLADTIKWWDIEKGTGSGFYLVEEWADWANPDTRHNGFANILWVDGHVSPSKWDRFAKDGNESKTGRYHYLKARNWNPDLP